MGLKVLSITLTFSPSRVSLQQLRMKTSSSGLKSWRNQSVGHGLEIPVPKPHPDHEGITEEVHVWLRHMIQLQSAGVCKNNFPLNS